MNDSTTEGSLMDFLPKGPGAGKPPTPSFWRVTPSWTKQVMCSLFDYMLEPGHPQERVFFPDIFRLLQKTVHIYVATWLVKRLRLVHPRAAGQCLSTFLTRPAFSASRSEYIYHHSGGGQAGGGGPVRVLHGVRYRIEFIRMCRDNDILDPALEPGYQ